VLGVIVGATVVRDVRTAAHTRVVLPKLRRKEEARAQLAVARPAV
jgi:predicted secreted Zn-dependent protease